MTSPSVLSTIQSIQSSTDQAYAAKSVKGSSDLGQDAFLRLMIEQMKNQDPSSPTDNAQMITQTAQFTQVTELQKLNKNVSAMNSYSQINNMMDRYVEIKDANGGAAITKGVVSEVRVSGDDVSVVLNGSDTTYPLSLVTKFRDAISTDPLSKPVVETPSTTGTATTTGTSTTNSNSSTKTTS